MASTIGIKIANGKFYPIMEENSSVKKRLILTTVHDNQSSVQIDLYRSAAGIMTDAQYIGSLVVEKIRPKPQGEPSIEMVVSSNSEGKIIAEAVDLDTSSGGEHYVLTVSLKSLDETSRDIDLPDFELETNEEHPSGLYNQANKIRQESKRKSKMWLPVLIGLIILLGLAALWLFLFGGLDMICRNRAQPAETTLWQPQPVPEPAVEPVREPEPVVQIVDPVPVIQAPVAPPPPREPAAARRRNPPVASYNVPAVIPREGINYRIRWGDTLWDISEAFYRDPWQYPRIARHNNIRNPNFIIAGRVINIPPRN
jgi:LysM repeat protein